MKFDIRQTNIAKGIAVMLLLWHHLFFNNPNNYSKYVSMFWVKNMPVEAFIANLSKVCVAMFMFISGYGLYISYEKYISKNGKENIKAALVYVKNRLIKLLSSFWVVYIIFVPISLFIGVKFTEIYGKNPLHYIADFFGVSYLLYDFDFTVNKTWWYMSVIIVYYAIYPLLHKICKFSAELLLAAALLISITFPTFREIQLWIMPFAFGMYASSRDLFGVISKKIKSKTTVIIISILLIIVFGYIKINILKNGVKFDFAFAFSVILFSMYFVSRIPVLNKVLEELGKMSGLIFMFHTFIYYIYFGKLIYSFKYSLLIYAVMLVICFAVAYAIDWLMKITRYKDLIKKITS